MRFCYADPPYLGCGEKHYGHQHEAAADYDSLDAHATLVERLTREFPEAWALSLSAPSLRHILPLCPESARVGAWVKPFASFKPNVNPAYCWEPVIFYGGRSASARGGKTAATVRDYVSANITLERGVSGAKPDAFSGCSSFSAREQTTSSPTCSPAVVRYRGRGRHGVGTTVRGPRDAKD